MPHRVESTTLASRYADGETLEGLSHPSSLLPMTVSPHSQSPVSSSWDNRSEGSTESSFVPDIPTTEPYPEHIGFGGVYYDDHLRNSHYHHGWAFPESGRGHDVRPPALQYSVDSPITPTQFVGGSRGEFDCLSPGCGNNGLSYTDEANTKLSNRIRRRCFNCKATETSTWRRSVLSAGKLLCNKCGLFERTHGIPRPKKFPRRRRAHSAKAMPPPSVHPNARNPPNGGVVNPHIQDIQSPTSPDRTHLVHAFDPISGEIFPQHASWTSPDGSDPSPARISRCYIPSQQTTVYHASRQSPPSALTDPIWI